MKINFIIIAGSSGGHILPAISLINRLNKQNKKLFFFTNEEGLKYKNLIINPNCEIRVFLNKKKFNLLFSQFFVSTKIAIKYNNLKIIGFGGLISIMPIAIFWLSKLIFKKNKIFIHEQNIIYGSANKVNYFFADYAFISFPKKNLKNKEIYIGNYFKKIPKYIYKHNDSKLKILLIGGSGGSIELNDFLMKFINTIPKDKISNYQFDIQIPKNKSEIIKLGYNKLLNKINYFTFRNDLNFKSYDLIFSRSGSGSLFEILYLTNKVYFIPHMNSRDKHQKFNKIFFQEKLNLIDNEEFILQQKNFYYFNKLINPYSIHKLSSFITN